MIQGQTIKNTYNGDGTTRVFNITFEFEDVSQIKFKVNSMPVDTNFSINAAAKTLTYPTVESELDPLTSADEIEIYRDTGITQDIDFENGGLLNAEMIEKGLDKLTMIAQELKKAIVPEDKGVITLPSGTDIDTLKFDGLYYVPSPTSTKGMPVIAWTGSPAESSYALVRVSVIKNPPRGTYFIIQEMILIPSHSGVSQTSEPQVYVRYLTDFTYSTQGWVRLNTSIITLLADSSEGSAEVITSTYEHNTRVTINASSLNGYMPGTAITSLTLYANSKYITEVLFKAGSGFTLNHYHRWKGSVPTFVANKTYLLTVEYGFMKCEEIN